MVFTPEEALDLHLRMSTLRMIVLLRTLQHAQYQLRLKTEEALSLQRRLRVVNDFAREEQLMREEAETALVLLPLQHRRNKNRNRSQVTKPSPSCRRSAATFARWLIESSDLRENLTAK